MSQIKSIIFLHESHFSKAYYTMFGINRLQESGFNVEVWNFTPFLKKADFQKETPPDPIKWKGHIYYHTKQEAKKALESLDRTCAVICGLHYTPKTVAFYRVLSKNKLIIFSNLAIALPSGTISKRTLIKNRWHAFGVKAVLNKLFQFVPFKYFGVKPVDYIIAMGNKYFRHGYPVSSESKIIRGHFYDYCNYLSLKKEPQSADPKKGVFLDEYLPFHCDNVDLGLPHVNADRYYSILRTSFDHLERSSGIRIVIAAHPRSHYDRMRDVFGGRPVVRGRTAELVRDSGFVILHQSMSLNYAVMFRKPMIFVTTDEVNRYLIEDPSIEWLASYFGKTVNNLDLSPEIDLESEMRVDDDLYRRYLNDYIKMEHSPDIPLWDIVANKIRNINEGCRGVSAAPQCS